MNKSNLEFQVAIDSLEGEKNLNLYFTSPNSKESLPAASSIKLFIGLRAMDLIEKNQFKDKDLIYKDIHKMLNISDNDTANRLIDKVGGFEKINSTIMEITQNTSTRINRYFLSSGKENTTKAKDLNNLLKRIYYMDYISEENS